MRRSLTDLDVLEIRRLHALGSTTGVALAERYNVKAATISQIVTGKRRSSAQAGELVIKRGGVTWYRRGLYWYRQQTGSAPAYEYRSACAGCGHDFFARCTATPTQGLYCSIRCSRLGEHNPQWRGDRVAYRGAHRRVALARGKASQCGVGDCGTGSTVYHWASLTGDYGDVWDYESMCVAHHRRYDFARARRMAPEPAESSF